MSSPSKCYAAWLSSNRWIGTAPFVAGWQCRFRPITLRQSLTVGRSASTLLGLSTKTSDVFRVNRKKALNSSSRRFKSSLGDQSILPSYYYTEQNRRTFSTRATSRSREMESLDDEFDFENDEIDDDDFNNNNDAALEPYQTLLELSGRASWRMTPATPPKALEAVKRQILDSTLHPTRKKHTHPTLLRMIEDQQGLRDQRERERRRVFKNKSYSKADKQQDDNTSIMVHGPDQAIAFIQNRLYPHYAMNKRVLAECQSLIPSFQPKRVMDFGSGCGSAAAASWDVFGDSVEWVHLIDASKTMREVSESLIKGLIEYQDDEAENADEVKPKNTVPPRITTAAHMSTDSDGVFDLCLSSFTMSELPSNNSILAAAALMYDKLRPGGMLVILEPGTPDGFANIRMIRNMLLDACPEGSDDACQIIAPCTHNGPCPIERHYGNRKERKAARQALRNTDSSEKDSEDENAENNEEDDDDESDIDDDDEQEEDEESFLGGTKRIGFCSFVQSIPGGTARRRGEKLSYLVVQKRAQDSMNSTDEWEQVNFPDHLRRRFEVTDPSQSVHSHLEKEVEELKARYLESDADDLGLELLRGEANRRAYGRIVEAPKKKKGHVIIDCCVEGGIERHNISKSLNSVAPGLYNASRKCRWGGFWLPMDSTKTI